MTTLPKEWLDNLEKSKEIDFPELSIDDPIRIWILEQVRFYWQSQKKDFQRTPENELKLNLLADAWGGEPFDTMISTVVAESKKVEPDEEEAQWLEMSRRTFIKLSQEDEL